MLTGAAAFLFQMNALYGVHCVEERNRRSPMTEAGVLADKAARRPLTSASLVLKGISPKHSNSEDSAVKNVGHNPIPLFHK